MTAFVVMGASFAVFLRRNLSVSGARVLGSWTARCSRRTTGILRAPSIPQATHSSS